MGYSIEDLIPKRGDAVQPAWANLLAWAKDQGLVLGKDVKLTVLPGGGCLVSAKDQSVPWTHPWQAGIYDSATGTVVIRPGMVNGQIPWVGKDYRLGMLNSAGSLEPIKVESIPGRSSYIAVGVNVGENGSEVAELSEEASPTELFVKAIYALPKGMNSGGVRIDEDGIAWYPLVRFDWDASGSLFSTFQIVFHNLGHTVVAGGPNKDQERHFFYGAG